MLLELGRHFETEGERAQVYSPRPPKGFMAAKKNSCKLFTVQVKVIMVADVEVEADSLEDALALGKTWNLKDVVTLNSAVSECDSAIELVGGYSREAWSLD
jgi:hypothetical protein